jgi:dipeptidyl-peptidase-4
VRKASRSFACVAVLVLFGGLAGAAERLTVEKAFAPELRDAIIVPTYAWRPDGRLLVLDSRLERSARVLQVLDPVTGKRTPAFDAAKAVAGFAALLGEGAPKQVGWPTALAPDGSAGAYVLSDDIYVLRFADASVRRLTANPAAEEGLSFSPDGSTLGFIRDNDLHTVDLRTGLESRLTSDSSETVLNGALSWVYWEEIFDHIEVPYLWSPDSKAIAYLQSDESAVSISTFVDYRPATQRVVRQRYPKAGQANPKVRLGVVELGSAKTTWVDAGSYEYIVRFGWLPGSTELSVQTMPRQQNELCLRFAERATGQSREILVERQPAWINIHDVLYFFADGSRFIWMSERDGYQHLYLYRIDGTLKTQLTKGEFMVIPSGGALTSGNGGLVGVDEKRGHVYFTANKEALAEMHLYRVGLDGKGMTRLTKARGYHAVELSPDKAAFLDTYSNRNTPSELALFKVDGSRVATITPANTAPVRVFELDYPELISFKAEDGLELPATIIKPKGFDPAKKYPVLIYVYGGPGAQQVWDRWGRRLWPNLLAQEGFVACTFEVRAGMGKNKATETSSFKAMYGEQNLKDILAGVAWLKQQPWVDATRLGIWGGSGGGTMTLYAMTRSDVFKAGISLFPVSDFTYYDTIYTERYMSTPQENPEGYKATSSMLVAGNLKGRLLIAHGTYDDNVHPQNTEAFVNGLYAKNIQFDLLIYPWRKHGISDRPGTIHLYTAMLEFWQRYLGK